MFYLDLRLYPTQSFFQLKMLFFFLKCYFSLSCKLHLWPPTSPTQELKLSCWCDWCKSISCISKLNCFCSSWKQMASIEPRSSRHSNPDTNVFNLQKFHLSKRIRTPWHTWNNLKFYTQVGQGADPKIQVLVIVLEMLKLISTVSQNPF